MSSSESLENSQLVVQANGSSNHWNKESQKEEIIKTLRSSLEFCEGNNESLTDITSTLNQSFPNASAVDIHECLVKSFPDLQAQQSNDQNEVYYLGIKLGSITPSEGKVVEWMRNRFVEDEFGSISSRTIIEMTTRELGSLRVNRLSTYIKKAFPKAYLRRSDRVRWYCGVSLPEQEMTEEEKKGKIWLAAACKWLRENITRDAAKREKCSFIYSALSQTIGKAGSEKYMAAVKAAFPYIQKKVFNHHAYYEGVGFINDAIRSEIKVVQPSKNSFSPKLLVTDETEQNIVDWLKNVVIEKENHREKLIGFQHLLQKRLEYEIPEKEALTYLRKAFINLKYRKRDGLYYIYGVEISNAYKPKDRWTQKSLRWIKQVFQETNNNAILRKLQPFIEIVRSGLQCSNPVKCCQLLKIAFPCAIISKSTDGRLISGVEVTSDFQDIEKPVFDDNDFTGDFSEVECHSISFSDQNKTSVDNSEILSDSNSSQGVVIDSSALIRLEEGMTILKNNNGNLKSEVTQLKDELQNKSKETNNLIGHLTEEVKSLREELSQSTRQRDTLIVQLQQSLMLLSQQQYQKLIQNQLPPPPPPSNVTATNNSASSSQQDFYNNDEHMMTMQALQNLHDNQITK